MITPQGTWEAPARDETILLLLSPDPDTVGWCRIAEEFTRSLFSHVHAVYWQVGTPFPQDVEDWEGDWLISFRGDLIIPERVYSRATRGAINIHPSPPHFRGLGGHYYAIYERHARFGSTCHHLARSVDAGDIIDVRWFPIAPGETVTSLRHHVGAESLAQYFQLVADYIAAGKPLPKSHETWGDKLYTSKELRAWIAEKKAIDPGNNCFR